MLYAPQNTDLGRFLRSIKRAEWRNLMRALRVTARESRIAAYDAAIYGAGFLKFAPGELPCRVPPADIFNHAQE